MDKEVNPFMNKYTIIAAAAGALMLMRQTGLAQTQTYSSTTNPRPSVTDSHGPVNNSISIGPGVGMNNPSQWGRANAAYVRREIAKAKADGKDVAAAQIQYAMGMKNLNNGMNKEAAQHFDSALRAVGVEPKAQGQNPGESTAGHMAMPGAAHP